MQIVRGLDQYRPDAPPSVVAQGTFDGIHLGHQAVIRTAVGRARTLGVHPVAVTFDPNPLAVLRPAEAPPELLPLEERLKRIAELGPEVCLVIPFTEEFSRVEAEVYVRDVLLGLLRAREIVVGFNHAFGRGARGTPDLLRSLAGPSGVLVHVVAPLRVDGVAVSSTAIREALRDGDVGRAASLLGRPFMIAGLVVRGAARGRTLGFPTANLSGPPGPLLADGVYTARAAWDGQSAGAVVNVGMRPTVDGATRIVEAHLLDVASDLYGRTLSLAFLHRIRAERRFASIEALQVQIAQDVEVARRLLGSVA
ncbi:MAG TPA: bifunctional riboflavin kinase/FAD synthetase [Methylomirabilota bacterium]|jgi:riboflavin kinase/FMN adenylyltransferase|nr:bifunctional riboflavin kinase/FAD synthetase [Methylomirabilota bacterium]